MYNYKKWEKYKRIPVDLQYQIKIGWITFIKRLISRCLDVHFGSQGKKIISYPLIGNDTAASSPFHSPHFYVGPGRLLTNQVFQFVAVFYIDNPVYDFNITIFFKFR